MKTKSNNKRVTGSSSAKYFNRIVGLNGNAARLSFYNPVGLEVPSNFFVHSILKSVPGIMRLGFVPGPGYSKDIASAVNVASMGICAYLTSNIGRPYAYDPQDYMQVIWAYESAVLHLVKLGRAIGTSLLVSGENRYIPDTLLEAERFDASIKTDLANARWLFNYYSNQLTKINIPNQFTFFNWHIKLMSGIFRDQDNLKAQLYLLDSDIYYVYDESQGACVANRYPSVMFLSTWRTIMDSMLQPLLTSQNVGNMSSDTKKAFGDNLFMLPKINLDYIVDITKDTEILNMIHNITLVGSVDTTATYDHYLSNLDITQDVTTSAILWQPILTHSLPTPQTGILFDIIDTTRVLDMPNDNPTEDEVLVATRGKTIITITSQAQADVIAASTEIYTTATVYNLTADVNSVTKYEFGGNYVLPYSSQTASIGLCSVCAYTVFDWAPKWSFGFYDSTTGVAIAQSQIWEVNNYLMLDVDVLTRINDGALASIYNIPEIGILK